MRLFRRKQREYLKVADVYSNEESTRIRLGLRPNYSREPGEDERSLLWAELKCQSCGRTNAIPREWKGML